MAFGPGSIAFVGFNGDGPDNLAFVVLQDLAAGTVIHFTDNEWGGSAFNTGEAVWSWTATGDVAAGSVVTMDDLAAGLTATSNLGTITFVDETNRNIDNGNEVIYAYVGTPEVPTAFLTAMANDDFGGNGSTFNTGLVSGETALELKPRDNDADTAAYDGRRVSAESFSEFLPLINNYNNWITQDGGGDNNADGIPPDAPFPADTFIFDPQANRVTFKADSLSVSGTEGDSGTTTLTFTVERTGSTDGDVTFTGSIATAGTTNADDFSGVLPTAFSGTIPDGASTGTFTVEVSGDTLFEQDESFTVTLLTAENTVTPSYVSDTDAVATGIIANDDAQPVDIAFVGFNADGTDNLAFVALGDIAAGTVVYFTDNFWNGTAFNTNENTWSWTATSDVPAGSIVSMDGLANGQTPASNFGTIAFNTTNNRDLATFEIVYAYLGEAGAPTAFIAAVSSYALTNADGSVVNDIANTGLTPGLDAISLADDGIDIAAYVGPRTGLPSLADFKALIGDRANWISQVHDYDQSQDGLTPDLPFSRAGFSTDPTPQVIDFAAASVAVSQVEGDAGMVDVTFTVERSGTTGVLDFWGALTPGGTDADDFGGTLPTTFTGTIPDGATSATVTVSVSGDGQFEADETFVLDLHGGSNPAASVVLGAGSQAAGTIVNDDIPQIVGFTAGSVAVAAAEGDAGTTLLTFTVERSGGTAGDVDFSGSLTPGSVDADDFGGVLPAGFSGTIPDGDTSVEITIAVSGDTDLEADETFTLALDSVTNPLAPVGIGDQGTATGTILNDEPVPAIAFTGFNSDGADNLAFAALSDIAAGTVIYFTDNEWLGTAFNAGESTWSWTAAADIADGTIVTMDGLAAGQTATSNLGTIAYIVEASRDIANVSEMVYAYVGQPDAPAHFLTALADYVFDISGSTLNGTGLVQGVNAVAFQGVDDHLDIAAYTGPRYGEAGIADYQTLINTPTNWITQDTSANDSADGVAPDVPFSTAAFTTDPDANVVGFAAGSVAVAAAEGDSGMTDLTFTVERTGSTAGAVDFAGTIAAFGALNADDFGGTLPTSFSGTIAAGDTSATVTIAVSGDTTFEQDESFTLTLTSAVNAATPAFVSSGSAVATGTILNDDARTVDIAFVGFNNGGPENMAFVALGDIAAGSTIQFTDNFWDGSAFLAGESFWSWTAGADIAAGTIVTLDGLGDGEAATSNLGSIDFAPGSSRDFDRYETIYAYTGDAGAPEAFLTAFSNIGFSAGYGPLTNTGLIAGQTAVAIATRATIGVYEGLNSGYPTFSDYRASINNGDNWISQGVSGDQSADGIDPDVPFDVPAFTIDPAAQLIQFADASLAISSLEGDSGTSALTFTLERHGSTSGTLDFAGSIAASGTMTADDFGGSVPTAFSGSFAEGETTATVTVTFAGDTIHEPDESVTLLLTSATNPGATVLIGGPSSATGTVIDDDTQTLDIAFVGFNADGNDALAFVALTDIAADTVIQFTDKTWYGDHFSADPANGSIWTWTASGDITAGSVVTLDRLNGATPTSNLGSIDRIGTGDFTFDIEEYAPFIHAYIGAPDQPTAFLSAFTAGIFSSYPDETGDDFVTALSGTGLSSADAVTARVYGATAAFGGAHAGYADWAALKAAINAGNWDGQAYYEAPYPATNAIPPDLPFPTLSYATDPAAQIVGFVPAPVQAKAEFDDGAVTTYTFTVARTGGTTGDVSFTGRVLTGLFEQGDQVTPEDFDGTMPTFSGTIADGETETTFTIEVSGDTTYENDETFYVQLMTLENTAGAPVAAGTVLAQGIILDFDPQPASVGAGEVINKEIFVEGGETFVVDADGKVIVDDGSAFSWISDGIATIDNFGYVRAGDSILNETAQGSVIFNNHVGATAFGGWDPSGRLLPGSTIVLNNAGTVAGPGRVLDFHDVVKGGGYAIINNLAGGMILQTSEGSTDMIRPGARTIVNNAGLIMAEPGYHGGSDGIDYQDNVEGQVNNLTGGWIEGDRHAVTGDHSVAVFNDVGSTMIGRNGSAVNLDTSASETTYITNYGTMEGRSAEVEDSDGDGIDIDGLLNLENYGRVVGAGHEGYHDGEPNISEAIAVGGGVINNYAGGELTSYGRAIQVDNSENGPAFSATTIYNEGLIEGEGHDPEGVDDDDVVAYSPIGSEAINLVGDWNDSLTNLGTIGGGVKMGGGNDTLVNDGAMTAGRAGAIDMGDGNDTLIIDAGATVTGAIALGEGNDTMTAVDATVSVDAGAGDDTVSSGQGNDTVAGGDGNDSLTGGEGNDSLAGDDGDDSLTGNAGADHLDGGLGNDSVKAGTGDDQVSGGDGDDWLNGEGGEDALTGGAGNDTLIGGASHDTLTGGDGSDRFYFHPDYTIGNPAFGDAPDVITDFSIADAEKINLVKFHFAGFAALQALLVADGADTLIDLSTVGGRDILVEGVTLAQLDNSANFVL